MIDTAILSSTTLSSTESTPSKRIKLSRLGCVSGLCNELRRRQQRSAPVGFKEVLQSQEMVYTTTQCLWISQNPIFNWVCPVSAITNESPSISALSQHPLYCRVAHTLHRKSPNQNVMPLRSKSSMRSESKHLVCWLLIPRFWRCWPACALKALLSGKHNPSRDDFTI